MDKIIINAVRCCIEKHFMKFDTQKKNKKKNISNAELLYDYFCFL